MVTQSDLQSDPAHEHWADDVELLGEHIALETGLILKIGAGALGVAAALALVTTVYTTIVGAFIALSALAALMFVFFRSWYVLVGILHEREEMRARLTRQPLISFTPSMLEAIRRPWTLKEYAWPALFLLPQLFILLLVSVGVIYHVAASQALFSGPIALFMVGGSITVVGSGVAAVSLLFRDRPR